MAARTREAARWKCAGAMTLRFAFDNAVVVWEADDREVAPKSRERQVWEIAP